MSYEAYCKAAVTNVETKSCDEGRRLLSKCDTPMRSVYRPELDKSPELKADGVQYYQELIGVLHWAVELGRVDIFYEVATMSTHLAMPRFGHLQELFHVNIQTGILIFVNRAPIIWYSKTHNTVKVSTFGSEITSTKNAIELIEALRYKLRMFGVPVDSATNMFCDNEAVTRNCSDPTSTLKKKHHSIAYHRNREAVAAGTIHITKEDTETNLSDLFTKSLGKRKREEFIYAWMY